jgi:hypothetical protein
VYSQKAMTLAVVAAAVLGCAGSKAPSGPNVACFRANDCQDGLVCVEGRCTDDLTPIVPEGAGVAGAGGSEATPSPDAG